MDETKQEKFARMAAIRIPKAVNAVKLLGNLSTRDYDPDKVQVDALFDQLYDAVDEVADRFGRPATDDASQVVAYIKAAGESPNEIIAAIPFKAADAADDVRPDRTVMGDVTWAFEMLQRGNKVEGMVMLKRAIKDWRDGRS